MIVAAWPCRTVLKRISTTFQRVRVGEMINSTVVNVRAATIRRLIDS